MKDMKELLNKASATIGNAAQCAKGVITDKVEEATQLGRNAAFSVENTSLSIRDSAMNTASGIAGAALKLCQGVTGTVSMMVELGIVVAAVAAPVPTLVGVGLLWLFQYQLAQSSAAVDKLVDEDREQRKLVRVTGLLKKYGQIPETATLETDLIKMAIDSKNGEVKGSVLSGEFQGRELGSLSSGEIARMLDFAQDSGTKGILEAYKTLRDTQTVCGVTDGPRAIIGQRD